MSSPKEDTNVESLSQERYAFVFYHGSYPLWVYLREELNIDISEVWSRVAKVEPVLETEHGKLVARVVNTPESLSDVYDQHIVFLAFAINSVFETLKRIVERDGVKILEIYRFKFGSLNEMYLEHIDGGRISERSIAVLKID